MKLASIFLLSAAFVVPPKVLSVPLYFNDRAAFDAAADSLGDLDSFDGRRLIRRFRRRFERVSKMISNLFPIQHLEDLLISLLL